MSPHSDSPVPSVDGRDSINGSSDYIIETNGVNGNGSHSSRSVKPSEHLRPAGPGSTYDLVCVGFGPASLAIAVALHDAMAAGKQLLPDGSKPNVLFLEKQSRFAWHAGMLLPGAKMQISFMKDMATLRDPRSHFTFLNYLHQADRLVEFINLSTFLPARLEYEDYLRWCAAHFGDVVQYNQEVASVSPDSRAEGVVKTFTVRARDTITGRLSHVQARNVLVAVGGQPLIPKSLPAAHPRVIHSSQYAHMVPKLLSRTNAAYRVAVVGAGQSAAEIFSNIQRLYPSSKTFLIMRSEFLRPSDDSPFINSIFNPSYINSLYPRSRQSRRALIDEAKATNYGVVRLELIEQLYERMYDQRREFGIDERKWPHRIMAGRRVVKVSANGNEDGDRMQIHLQKIDDCASAGDFDDGIAGVDGLEEVLDVDLIIAATGYQRNSHVDMLRDSWELLPEASVESTQDAIDGWTINAGNASSYPKKMEVTRDYRVQFSPGKVAAGSGVWLQGCCEATHGLSDTLLSVLATRSGEMVDSIFPSWKML